MASGMYGACEGTCSGLCNLLEKRAVISFISSCWWLRQGMGKPESQKMPGQEKNTGSTAWARERHPKYRMGCRKDGDKQEEERLCDYKPRPGPSLALLTASCWCLGSILFLPVTVFVRLLVCRPLSH